MKIDEIHNLLLELMVEFDDLCKKNNIDYTLHGGSLLGAIREKGFISWDDDFDVAMTRVEFDKLLKVIEGSSLTKEYLIVGDIKKQFRNAKNNLVWIDIFICDYISEKYLCQKIKLCVLTILDIMNRDKDSIKLSNLKNYNIFKRVLYKFIYYIGNLIPKKIKIQLYNRFSADYFLGNHTLMFRSNDQYVGRNKIFKASNMTKYEYAMFETVQFEIISEYHEMLVSCYGKNYMIPQRDNKNVVIHSMIRKKGGIGL